MENRRRERAATPAADSVHGPGTLLSGRYLLEERIARTVMSSIWRAHDDRLGRPVIAKLMALDLAEQPEARSRFEREAKAAAQLASPHIVTVFDFGESENVPYIVLEPLVGQDLHHRLAETTRLPATTCVWIAEQAGAALAVAHEAGVVHRDIKPSNLFLCRTPGMDIDTLKVLDFGIAKLMGESRRTAAGTVVGSPLFMSPEQALGQTAVDPRTDLYSLAVVLYRCLTGELPFRGSLADVLVNLVKTPPRAPSSVAPDLGTRFDAFFQRALAKAPADRYPDARALVAAFREVALHESAETVRVVDDDVEDRESVTGVVPLPDSPTVTLVRQPTGPMPAAPGPRTLLSASQSGVLPRRERLVAQRAPIPIAEAPPVSESDADFVPTALGVIPASISDMARRAATSASPEEEAATSIAAIPSAIGVMARNAIAVGTSAAWSPDQPPHVPDVPTGPVPVVDPSLLSSSFVKQAPLIPPTSVMAVAMEPPPSVRPHLTIDETAPLRADLQASLAAERSKWVASDPSAQRTSSGLWWKVPLWLLVTSLIALATWTVLRGWPP